MVTTLAQALHPRLDEQHIHPLRVIGLCLLATAVTLVLVRSETSYDVIGSAAWRS